MLLPPCYYPRHTSTHQHILNSSLKHTAGYFATMRHSDHVHTIDFSLCFQVLIYGWVNRSIFRIKFLSRNYRYRRLGVWPGSNPRSCVWESNTRLKYCVNYRLSHASHLGLGNECLKVTSGFFSHVHTSAKSKKTIILPATSTGRLVLVVWAWISQTQCMFTVTLLSWDDAKKNKVPLPRARDQSVSNYVSNSIRIKKPVTYNVSMQERLLKIKLCFRHWRI